MSALLGVLLGGRLGYMLFYNLDAFLDNPLVFFHFLDGGMASHGGIIGLIVFTLVYARRKHISWRGIGDNLCTAAPLGLFFGRMANFINGELYGRKAEVAWAVQFPEEIREPDFSSPTGAGRAALEHDLQPFDLPPAQLAADGKTVLYDNTAVIEAVGEIDGVKEVLRDYLNARHPSQIYQALMEGLALFLILYFVRVRYPTLRHGILTGIFFIGYAVFRILGEQFREPSDGFIGAFTRGQFLSLFMVLIGGAFVASAYIWPYRQKLSKRLRRSNSRAEAADDG